LQWFCEGGIVGGLFLMTLWGLWGASLFAMLKRREHVAPEVIWACSLITLVSFNAVWTRPFHRIENILWLSLAFALANKDILSVLVPVKTSGRQMTTRLCGLLLLAGSCGGFYYLGDGMVGDRLIRRALSTQDAAYQRTLLEQASRHFMVRNDALKNLGYHYIQVGEQTQNVDAMSQGVQLLWQHFLREPHSEELRVLIDWAQRFQRIEILQMLASYLKPGAFRLETRPSMTDSAGNVVSATLLVPVEEAENQQAEAEQ
jgi:hypothetical protein